MKTKIDKEKAKTIVKKTADKTAKLTRTLIILIFGVMIIYTIFMTAYLIYSSGISGFLTNIATLSIGGFWAFFLGYFGWRMGQIIEEYYSQIRRKK